MHPLSLRFSPPAHARLACLFVLLFLLTQICSAQPAPVSSREGAPTFSFDHEARQIVSLDGLWRFHAGDDLDGTKGWAAPDFDDSSWALVRSDKSWPAQQLPVASGSFWYRARLSLPGGDRPLSILIPALHINYQIYADGRLIGGAGPMPPHPRAVRTDLATFQLPRAANAQGRTVVIAIRAWRFPLWSAVYPYGLEPGMLIGDTRLIDQISLLNTRELSWGSVSTVFLALLEMLAGLAALALFKVRIQEREYLWFGVAMLVSGVNDSLTAYRVYHALDVLHFNLLQAFFQFAILFAFVGFYQRLMESRRDSFYRFVIASLSVAFFLNVAGFAPWVLSKSWAFMDFFFTAVFLLQLPFYFWVLSLLVRKASAGRADALILLVPNALGLLDLYVPFMLYIGKPTFGWNVGTMNWFTRTAQWPFPFSIDNISSFLLMATMFGVLVHRFTRTSLREEDQKREIEAARIVQQVLIPDAIPAIAGFSIQAVYRPAGQVGGDFFQVIPILSGGVLIAIGDVSGKGMPAAMTVSLLVGTVRTLAHFTQKPSEILAAMNQRMLARSAGGFTTCLVLCAEIDGSVTVANAGHIAPYLQGRELQVESGLPLGLAADSAYKESTFHLAKGDQLTLVTDGVVEARDKEGVLLGFERTAGISELPAESVARTAVDFGQEDDITVVTLVRSIAEERSAVPLWSSATAPSAG